MSREEDSQADVHDLSELEVALAALVPRMEPLNRDRLMFLAGQASVGSKIGQPASQRETAGPRRQVGWAWPAALAAMTGIAASLLVALVVRPASQVTERQGPQAVERPAAAPATPQEPASTVSHGSFEPDAAGESPTTASPLPGWLVWGFYPQPTANTKQASSYAELRDQVLTHGLERWKPAASGSAASSRTDEEPTSSREQLHRWLEQEGVEGGLPQLSTPTRRNSTGARS